MNVLITASLIGNSLWLAASTLDGNTVVPLGPVLGSAATVLLCGMWISRKVTRFEELCLRFAEQQTANITRLDALDKRLLTLLDSVATNTPAVPKGTVMKVQ